MTWKEIAATAAVAWPVISGIANMILAQKTDEEWVAFAEQSPRLAAASKFLKAIGFNPAGAIKSIRALLSNARPASASDSSEKSE